MNKAPAATPDAIAPAAKHTALPWRYENQGRDITGGTDYIATLAYGTTDDDETAANAAFIILACNNHYSLRDAAAVALDALRNGGECAGTIKALETALGKVEGDD